MPTAHSRTEYANGIIAEEWRISNNQRCQKVETCLMGDLVRGDAVSGEIARVLKVKDAVSLLWQSATINTYAEQNLTPQQVEQVVSALKIAQDIAAQLDSEFG